MKKSPKPEDCKKCGESLSDADGSIHSMVHQLMDVLNTKEAYIGFSAMMELMVTKSIETGLTKEQFLQIADDAWNYYKSWVINEQRR